MKKGASYFFSTAAFLCLLTALVLMILLRIFSTDSFLSWYNGYTKTLNEFELWIETYGATWIAVVVILLNYTIKAFIPWFPLSCICVASAVIFKWYIAVIINIVGMSIYFTAKFLWGRKHGGGNAEKLLSRYDRAHTFIDSSKAGSKAVLFFSRLLPGLPLGSVSTLYGSTDMKLYEYLIISVAGFLYKIVSYVIIGRNVFDPASFGFIIPFIPLLIFTGVVLLSVSGVVSTFTKRSHRDKNSD